MNITHMEALKKARMMAETARPALTDHEFWNNDYTDDMIAIVRDPKFMSQGTFFTYALAQEDRDFCERFLLRSREIEIQDRAVRERLRREAELKAA
ncbi:hypothetical protein [Agrobacterium tumefaciens]|uniref:hypothetical protein n=1 Tax=Agrobacterium tumefaciens TaxID=358 RepID=UPI0021D163EE|nr:hypothetical protein [Agrobacterium tumefaciens]UXS01650.1 hypothetical protein FY156_09310 [Agrobacterium tumefaciens]